MRVARLALATLISGVFLVALPATPAYASCTDFETTEESLFVKLGTGGSFTTVYGNWHTLEVRNRDLNSCGTGSSVDGDAITISTVHVQNSNGLK